MAFAPPIPKSPFIDQKTGLISRDWYLFLLNLFNASGGGAGGTATQVLHGGGAGYSAVDLTADVTQVLPGVNGGTGVSNALKTVTLGGNIVTGAALTTTPGNAVTLQTTGPTLVTLPTSGTVITGVNLSGDVFATGTNTGTAVATITSGAITTSKIASGAITVTQISTAAVTNVKLANMPPNTFKANNTGTTGVPVDITSVQALTQLGYVDNNWTPVDASGAGLVITATTAKYTVFGRVVFIEGFLTYPVNASGAAAVLSGLPFTVSGYGTAALLNTGTVGGLALFVTGTQTISFNTPLAAGITNLQLSGANLLFSGFYFM